MKKSLVILVLFVVTVSCISTKNTIKNIDDAAPAPQLVNRDQFLVTEAATDKKYGYDPDYPINVFHKDTRNETLNAHRFLNALTGPNGEEISFVLVETCCPFPSKRTEMGVGLLDVYEISWKGQAKPIHLYLNIYEKGYLFIPTGLTAKKR